MSRKKSWRLNKIVMEKRYSCQVEHGSIAFIATGPLHFYPNGTYNKMDFWI